MRFLKNIKESSGGSCLIMPLVLVLIGSAALYQWHGVLNVEREANNIAWKQAYPEAKGSKYTYCDENGFLTEAIKYSSSFSERLVTADNKVPIRCRSDYHTTVENTGKTSTHTLF